MTVLFTRRRGVDERQNQWLLRARTLADMRLQRVKESARRAYGEIVKGRTRVQVIHSAEAPAGTQARFILSPYRSGTTLLRYCLDSHPDIAVPPESDFVSLIAAVMEDEASMAGYRDLGYDTEHVRELLAHTARVPLDTYASGRESRLGWVDKSPRYAEEPLRILALFPEARFVIMHRHPLDQIHSFTRAGSFKHPALGSSTMGKDLVLTAARYWHRTTRGLTALGESENTTALSIRYEDLCSDPRNTLGSITSHFHLPWNESVLNYHLHNHDLGREAGRVAGTRGFSLSTGGWGAWQQDWIDDTWDIVASAAQDLGYSKEPWRQGS